MVAFLVIFALMLNLTDCLYIHTVQTFQDLRQQGQKGPAIAFTALVSKNTDVGSKAVVKYDRILSNVGGAYHPSTGTFTAPFKGVYSISCSLMSDPSNSVHLQITKNGSKLSILYSASSTHPHAGQTLQLLLNKGDKIWIQNVNSVVAKLHDHG
ncbi:complement C1q tumor necrosis factor-related protein 6-like [Crassostrea virginica]